MLDRASPVPLYHQMAQHLQEQIASGTLTPGDALPTEEELKHIYGVSRATVRQAVQQLASADLVRLARPHGTFVTQPRLVEPLPALISFSDEVRRAGLTPSTRVLRVSLDPAPPEVRQHLNLAAAAAALCVRRLRLANDQPITLHTSWLAPSLGFGVDDDFGGSLYGLLRARGAEPLSPRVGGTLPLSAPRAGPSRRARSRCSTLPMRRRTRRRRSGCRVRPRSSSCRASPTTAPIARSST